MALIVEDGTGLSNAESYASIAQASAWFAARGDNTWATITTDQMEAAARRATDYMIQVYRGRWLGYRVNTTQALDFPRYDVPYKDSNAIYPSYYASDSVPTEIVTACIMLMRKAAAGELLSDTAQIQTRVKVGEIEVEYDPYSSQTPKLKSIDQLLAPFLADSGSGVNHRLVR